MLKANVADQLIHLLNYKKDDILELVKQKNKYSCPYCKTDLILKVGDKRVSHFAHKVKCCYEGGENESFEHYQAKQLLCEWLEKLGADHIEQEEVMQKINRIADISFNYKKEKYVFEIQKSQISDDLYLQRSHDYKSLGIKIIWIFISDIKQREITQVLSPNMLKHKQSQMIHLDIVSEKITFFQNQIWLTQKEVLTNCLVFQLSEINFDILLKHHERMVGVKKEEWLKIKSRFRKSKSFVYVKYDKSLRQLCYTQRIPLSLAPAEIGWPIDNNYGMTKPLFIWQSYVLLGVVMKYKLHDVFTLKDVVDQLKFKYQFKINRENIKKIYEEVKAYLALLETFMIINQVGTYYEYVKIPRLYSRLEEVLVADELLATKLNMMK
ncbi:MAG: competence protein CoiA [Turicibacter sp.]